MHSDSSIQYLLDRAQIQDTIARYALGQDSHQGDDTKILEQWDEVFTEEGMTDYSSAGAPRCHYRELARWMRGGDGHEGRMTVFINWQHMLSLPVITIDGDTATARTDYFATHKGRSDERGWSFYAAGAFHDELVRTEKGWRIRLRTLEVYFQDMFETLPLPEQDLNA